MPHPKLVIFKLGCDIIYLTKIKAIPASLKIPMSALSFITVSVSSQNLLFPDMLLTLCVPDLLCLSHLLSSFCSQKRFSVWFLCASEGCSSVFTDSCSLVYLMSKYYSNRKYSFVEIILYTEMYQGSIVIAGIKYTFLYDKWWLCSYYRP